MGAGKDKRITDLQVRNLKPNEKLSEPADREQKKGFGTLLFKCTPSGVIEGYYRQRIDGKDIILKLGVYKADRNGAGMTVAQIRTKANEYASIATEHKNVKDYVRQLAAEKTLKQAEAQRLMEIEASRGTFKDLFLDYIDSRRGKAAERTVKELERIYLVDMLDTHPSIMALKARDVQKSHILEILNPVWERGAKVQADHLRSYLSAAFSHGLKSENTVGRSNAKTYSLEINPAASVDIEKVSAPIERALSNIELRQFWSTIECTEGIGPVMALLFKFVIASGGQRIFNICQTTWDDYDLEAGTVRLVHRKGRGGQSMERPHLVPLTGRALSILEDVRALNGCYTWPWTTTGKAHIVVSSPNHAVKDWLKSKYALIADNSIPPFSPRDLRRTCAQLMQRHGVSDQLSDLLQAHGQTGVANKHYRNNPEAALPEKWRAIGLFDQALEAALTGVMPTNNVRRLRE